MRLALVGASLSGKSTLADYLAERHGWYKINYTALLKELTAVALNAVENTMNPLRETDNWTVRDILDRKAELRPLINELGTALGFDEGYGIDKVLARWAAKGSPEPVVFDNVRFEAQAEKLRGLGFVMVGLQVPGTVLYDRAMAAGIPNKDFQRQYEWDTKNLPAADIILDGSLTTYALADILNRLAGVKHGNRSEAA